MVGKPNVRKLAPSKVHELIITIAACFVWREVKAGPNFEQKTLYHV